MTIDDWRPPDLWCSASIMPHAFSVEPKFENGGISSHQHTCLPTRPAAARQPPTLSDWLGRSTGEKTIFACVMFPSFSDHAPVAIPSEDRGGEPGPVDDVVVGSYCERTVRDAKKVPKNSGSTMPSRRRRGADASALLVVANRAPISFPSDGPPRRPTAASPPDRRSPTNGETLRSENSCSSGPRRWVAMIRCHGQPQHKLETASWPSAPGTVILVEERRASRIVPIPFCKRALEAIERLGLERTLLSAFDGPASFLRGIFRGVRARLDLAEMVTTMLPFPTNRSGTGWKPATSSKAVAPRATQPTKLAGSFGVSNLQSAGRITALSPCFMQWCQYYCINFSRIVTNQINC